MATQRTGQTVRSMYAWLARSYLLSRILIDELNRVVRIILSCVCDHGASCSLMHLLEALLSKHHGRLRRALAAGIEKLEHIPMGRVHVQTGHLDGILWRGRGRGVRNYHRIRRTEKTKNEHGKGAGRSEPAAERALCAGVETDWCVLALPTARLPRCLETTAVHLDSSWTPGGDLVNPQGQLRGN